MKQNLKLKASYLAVASMYFPSVFIAKEWYSGVVTQLLNNDEFGLSASGYLCAYEHWKETKPFGRKLGGNELGTLFSDKKIGCGLHIKNILKKTGK